MLPASGVNVQVFLEMLRRFGQEGIELAFPTRSIQLEMEGTERPDSPSPRG